TAIAVANPTRIDSAPEVPTFEEAGIKGFESNSWFGVVVPDGTPEPVVQKLSAELQRIVNLPQIRQQFAARGLEASGMTSQKFAEYLKSEMDKAARLVQASGAAKS